MPAKWQQWMPFHIDRFKASPAVQAMPPAARIGYLYLLSCCWQSDDCTIPGDDEILSELSGLGDELWSIHGDRILRKFGRGPDDRLFNHILKIEWDEARKIYEARQSSAKRTNTVRWSIGDRSVTDEVANRSADTRTLTVTTTETNTKDSSPKTRKKSASDDGMKHSSDPRHLGCKNAIFDYYRSKNNGNEPPWNGQEGKALGMLLGSDPKMDGERMRSLLRNRFKSLVNHAERPGRWMGYVHNYAAGPLDQFGKPIEAKNSQPKPQILKMPISGPGAIA
jgi:hypothetical protein